MVWFKLGDIKRLHSDIYHGSFGTEPGLAWRAIFDHSMSIVVRYRFK